MAAGDLETRVEQLYERIHLPESWLQRPREELDAILGGRSTHTSRSWTKSSARSGEFPSRMAVLPSMATALRCLFVRPKHLEISSSEFWFETLRDHVIPWVIDTVDLGGQVLEIGPGPGLSTDLLRVRVPALTAVEPDAEMAVDLASRLSGSNVGVVRADVTALPFKDRRFTAAASFSTLHHIPTVEMQDQLLGEVARVLRPGSVFAAYDGIANQGIADLHADLTYNPVDPSTIEARLLGAGFASVRLRTVVGLRWAAIATISDDES